MTRTPAPVTDRFAAARTVADAVLYEGYLLYPYRASARKNQVRWQFGVLAPQALQLRPTVRSAGPLRTECIVDPGTAPTLAVRVRCLQVQRRTVEAVAGPGFVETDGLDVDGTRSCPGTRRWSAPSTWRRCRCYRSQRRRTTRRSGSRLVRRSRWSGRTTEPWSAGSSAPRRRGRPGAVGRHLGRRARCPGEGRGGRREHERVAFPHQNA